MTQLSEPQIGLATWLLRHSRGKPEDAIRQRIGQLLDTLDIDWEQGYAPSGAGGSSDIFLPRHRTFIETKAVGLADDPYRSQQRDNNESPKEQLERYLFAERQYELGCLPLQDAPDRPWMGIVTDGRIWHVWRYSHSDNDSGTAVEKDFRPGSAEELIARLEHFLAGDLVGKPWIPADPRPIFEPFLEELREIHSSLRGEIERHTETKRRLWLDMLRTASMEPENEAARQRLFTAHSFLVALARAVIRVLETGQQGAPENDARGILADGFTAWVVDTTPGRLWADRLFGRVNAYEWRRRPGDVLRPLYERFVDEKDRKVFGEFYTPDWLAEMIVREVCDDAWCRASAAKALDARRTGVDLKGVGVLDPTCGSGTFLYYAARKLLKALDDQYIEGAVKSDVVCRLVHGIDVHPVAAEIARATLLRALPADPPRGKSSLQIHEGDALLIRGDDDTALFRPSDDEIRIYTPLGEEIYFPEAFVKRGTFADDLRRFILSAQQEEPLPQDILMGLTEESCAAVQRCHELFRKVIQLEGNSVWSWYIQNITAPYRLAQTKVDRIVANPPWVKMADIQAEKRKRAVETLAQRHDMEVWTGGRQAPHFDIAQLFIKRARQLYLVDPSSNPAAWLVKKSALRAGNWRKFRVWHDEICAQTLDLEPLQPFGGGDARRSCVLFEQRASARLIDESARHLIARPIGDRPKPTQTLEKVLERVVFEVAPKRIPQASSDYLDERGTPVFRQGATIVPRVLTVVRQSAPAIGEEVIVRTVRSQHRPWSVVSSQEGSLPAHWIQSLMVSKAVVPFAIAPGAAQQAIIPVVKGSGLLLEDPEAGSPFWASLDAIYREHKGAGNNTPVDLISQIDFAAKLSSQLPLRGDVPKMVIYPSSGDIMRACRFSPGDGIIDYTLFRYVAYNPQEAAYLVALLNAPSLNEAFVQSRSSGRHFQLHPWRKVPIRRFVRGDSRHRALARLTEKAEAVAEEWLSESSSEVARLGQVGLSSRIRALLASEGIFAEIDGIVRDILPDQAVGSAV